MFKPKGLLLVLMIVVLVSGSTGFLFAAQNASKMARPGANSGMEPRMETARFIRLQRFARGLGLTVEQRIQIREILVENKDRILQAGRNVIEARLNLNAGSEESAEAFGDAHCAAAMLKVQIFDQIKSLLTAEQLEQVQNREQLRKERLETWLDRLDNRLGE